ncbi:ribonuclease T2 [Suillus paluster]|uniref:ribonuclease T2 n=1 Tax=Suillus paluster TaxID=48578 RepID=UPI001B87BBFC|nr:ribonuclease T2 [Suillus paluster]KAG1754932.1 ribonuclease T2 [Suillus paluster]
MSLSSLVLSSLLGSSYVNPTYFFQSLGSSGCGTSGPISCQNTNAPINTCCYETPGLATTFPNQSQGLILQTQVWDTDVAGSPTDSWTIHGLWPDNYIEKCDPSRDYTNITGLLNSQGATSTLDYMQQYWLNDDGTDEEFWEHEWATHGTCYSTLNVDCLPSNSPVGAEAVAFFGTVVELFKTLPTYDWLADAGITPSSSETYTLSSLQSALKAASGFTPALGCSSHKLSSISWYFNLKGSVIDGDFIPIDTPKRSSCPSRGIKYLPKEG